MGSGLPTPNYKTFVTVVAESVPARMDMNHATCHPAMPQVRDAYFAAFDPAALALICEATLLEPKLSAMAGVECGIIWAAVRAIERGEGRCSALAGLTSRQIEDSYRAVFRKITPPRSVEHSEHAHGMNMLVVLPPRCKPDESRLDYRSPVTPGVLLAEIIAKFDYEHAANIPIHEKGLDVREVCRALGSPDGFVPGDVLRDRGTVPAAKQRLYERACEKAAFVGTWLVRDVHIAAGAAEMGMPLATPDVFENLLGRWEDEVTDAQDHVAEGGYVFLCSFPGPRPWTPSACRFLEIPFPPVV